MEINLPSRIRAVIYICVVLGTAIVVPLHAAKEISDLFLNVWTSVAGAASGLALLNVTPDPKF